MFRSSVKVEFMLQNGRFLLLNRGLSELVNGLLVLTFTKRVFVQRLAVFWAKLCWEMFLRVFFSIKKVILPALGTVLVWSWVLN